MLLGPKWLMLFLLIILLIGRKVKGAICHVLWMIWMCEIIVNTIRDHLGTISNLLKPWQLLIEFSRQKRRNVATAKQRIQRSENLVLDGFIWYISFHHTGVFNPLFKFLLKKMHCSDFWMLCCIAFLILPNEYWFCCEVDVFCPKLGISFSKE